MAFGALNFIIYAITDISGFEECQSIDNALIYGICIFNENTCFSKIKGNKFLMEYQLWNGFVMCVLWMIGLRLIISLGLKKHKWIDDSLDSASDYTVKIENLPYGSYHEEDLISYLRELWIEENS